MLSFFQRSQNTLCGVIIDIGSGSVAASIVLSDHRKKLPEIVYTHRECMPIRSTNTSADDVRSMRHALFLVMFNLEHRGMAALRECGKRTYVQRILVSCTAPWSHTITQIIHFEQDTPFTVTPHLIDKIILHAYDKEETHTGERIKTLKDQDQHIVEKSIIDITLNGYPIANPYNKEASEITLAHVRGLIPTSILTALEDIKKRIRSSIDMRIHTSALMLYCVLRDLYPQSKSALIIDISGEATEIALIQNSILYESIAVAYGMNSLIRDIAGFSGTIPEEARGYLRGYKQKVLTYAQEKALLEAQKRYLRSLETVFQELTLRYVLPRTIFLILDQNMEQFFTDTIESAVYDREGRREKMLVPLTPTSTRDFVVVPSGVVVDPRLSITARFFHKLHACGEIDN